MKFFLCHSFQVASEAHPASYPIGTECSFPDVKIVSPICSSALSSCSNLEMSLIWENTLLLRNVTEKVRKYQGKITELVKRMTSERISQKISKYCKPQVYCRHELLNLVSSGNETTGK
jgi:hypothetical protein